MTFTIEETVWIPLPCGTRLATTIWRPDGAGPFPAVLEYLPYRRRDGTSVRDDSTYPGFAAAQIVGVRVDSRGQGDSEGLFDDEYSPTELQDACDVIEWIAAQPWSNGAVGMMGISWGGFNALQVAALRPPALKAVISIASTTDRFADDIHYKGGALLSANVSWAATMLSYTSRPPDPEVVGEHWLDIWRRRLAEMPPLLETWLSRQHRDAYWQHGSVCEDWGAIQIPVWVIAGWADGYRNTPFELAAHAEHSVKAMTGPWVHKYPHFAWPDPRADFLGLAVDWWHHWLSGIPQGVEGWPGHAVYRVEAARPGSDRRRDQGAWVDAGAASVRPLVLGLGADRALGSDLAGEVEIATPQHCGTTGGEYFCTAAGGVDMAGDQRADDRLATCWEWTSHRALDLIGRARLEVPLAIDRPVGTLIARLVDVHPDGTAALIARGVLNLCHRDSHAAPSPMIPGETVNIALDLDAMAYRVRAGHRLRLALSTAYWPMVLPPPAPVSATLRAGPDARLVLPETEAPYISIPEPPADTVPAYEVLDPGTSHRGIERDPVSGRVRTVIDEQGDWLRHPRNGMEWREDRAETWEIAPDDPLSCRGHLLFTAHRRRGDWETRTETEITFTSTAVTYEADLRQTAWHGDAEIHHRTWQASIPRRLV